jgi:FKBP-type peptidyl-prolyl cis-trans isomerase FkpA
MMRRLLYLIGALGLAGCLSSTDVPSGTPSDPTTETFASNLGVNISQMQKTEHGVFYKDVSVGTGATLSAPVTVVVTYAGFLKNGALFDSGEQATIPLSNAAFGFQEGMIGMHLGGERLIVIPSELGFGSHDVITPMGTIPANSTLVFDVHLDQIP